VEFCHLIRLHCPAISIRMLQMYRSSVSVCRGHSDVDMVSVSAVMCTLPKSVGDAQR